MQMSVIEQSISYGTLLASRWLNQRVEVTGRVERDSKGREGLMKVFHPKLVDAPENSPDQIEFDFPDRQI